MADAEIGLRFYPKSHRYRLDGEWVPSVTGILDNAIPKPGIPFWAANMVAEYVDLNPDRIRDLRAGVAYNDNGDPVRLYDELRRYPWRRRDQAAERGTLVHAAAEKIVQGETVEVDEYLAGYVQSCIAFLDDWKIDPVLIEARVASRTFGYAGTLDLIADHPSGPRAIFDYKTSDSGIKFQTAFQNAGYVYADFHGENGDEHPMQALNVVESWAVHLQPDGYTVYPLPLGPDIFKEFIHGLEWAEILRHAEGDYKTPGTGGYVGEPVNRTPNPTEDW